MTKIHWLNPVSADFNTAADWSTGTAPGSGDAAILDAAGSTHYTVTASTSETVLGLQLANTAALAITGGTFTDTDGFNSGGNAGTIAVGNGSAFATTGTISNTGTIALGSTGAATTLDLFGSATLTGGGTISLSDNAENAIVDEGGGFITNADNTIVGSGTVGGGNGLAVTNGAGGIIDADNTTPLTINTGMTTARNAGLIETTGKGRCTIDSPVDNTGTLEANGGVLTVRGEVAGPGSAVISAGTIDFKAFFSQNVIFTGRSGKLELGASFTGSVTGFSKTGGTSFDLRDIGFVSSTEATFSGTAASGVLTVTDGTHTAHINLTGNYLSSTFVASSDGHGGTIVIDPKAKDAAPPLNPSPHPLIAAMAALGPQTGAVWASQVNTAAGPLLAPRLLAPRTALD